jgi:hypothetical protein
MHYRTEIVISPDRYVCIQLPAYLPEGRARVIVMVDDAGDGDAAQASDADPDRQDIEWWEEFEADPREGV